MRKKLVAIMCMLCLTLFSFAVVPAMASNEPANNLATVEGNTNTYELNFNGDGGSKENVATTGTNVDANLVGGKTLTVSMDIIESTIPENNLGVFFLMTNRALIEKNWASNYLFIGTRLSNAGLGWVGADLAKKSFTINELFKAGSTLKIEYKPYVDETNKGAFIIYKKVTGADDSTFVECAYKKDLPKEKAPQTTGFYISAYGEMKLIVQNYTIKVSDGTVLDKSFTYSYKGDEDAGGYQFDTSMSIKRVTDSKDYHILFNQSSAYFGSEETTTISSGESLVMEYDVINSNLVKNNFNMGIVITPYIKCGIDNVENATGSISFLGNSAFEKNKYATYCRGPYINGKYDNIQTMEGEFIPANIFATANRVKIVYKPYVSETEKGSFEIYTTSIFSDEYTVKFRAYDLNKEYALSENLGIYTILQNGVSWLKNSNFTLHINNYRIYTTNNKAETTKDIPGLGSSDKCIIKELEKDITIQSGLDASTKEIVYAKVGAKVIVRADNIDGYKFCGWYDNNGKLVNRYTIDAIEIMENTTSLTAKFVKIPTITTVEGASIRTKDPMGLRFKTQINKKEYDALKENADSIKLGTLIIPTDMLTGHNFTMEELNNNNIQYINIVNEGWFNQATLETDENYEYCGSIVNIKEHNIARRFSAISYIEYEIFGQKFVQYSSNAVERSVYEVAKKFVQDEKVTDENIKNAVKTKYIDTVLEVKDNKIVEYTGYTSPYTIEVKGNELTITAKNGNINTLKNIIINNKLYNTFENIDEKSLKIILQ